MHPELFDLPILGWPIKMYGFFLMIGFLSAVWLAMRRAQRVKCDPDVVLDMSFLALIFGVAGARVFYVVHHWHPQFAGASNKVLAVVNITQGGLEFLGGFLGAAVAIVVYALRKRISIRLYLDILAPSAMWGLAFGRLGCFFNGCCFGGVCPTDGGQAAAWAVEFPFGSPAQMRQWEERQVTVPAELIWTGELSPRPFLVPAEHLAMSEDKRRLASAEFEEARSALERAKSSGADTGVIERLTRRVGELRKKRDRRQAELSALLRAQQFPSRFVPSRNGTSVSELNELAEATRSRPVHPTQLYSSIHAMILSLFLSSLFYVRKRHGVVIAALFLMYPVPRLLLERIRVDNPVHIGGLTASQWVSVGMVVIGLVALYMVYVRWPARSKVLG